jgi:hypothetical protein
MGCLNLPVSLRRSNIAARAERGWKSLPGYVLAACLHEFREDNCTADRAADHQATIVSIN